MSRPAAARRPRTPGAHVKPESTSLVLKLAPDSGVKQELLAVKKTTGKPAKEIAALVLQHCLGHYGAIVKSSELPPLPGEQP